LLDLIEHSICLVNKAQTKRKISSTKMNQKSSRGYVVYIIRILKPNGKHNEEENSENDFKNKKLLHTMFNLIDLAGSERISK
jgi:hypothetical protein